MLTIRGRLITPFVMGSMSVGLNILIRHSFMDLWFWITALVPWPQLHINNIYFDQIVDRIYPTELQLNRANSSDTEAPFWDLNLCIKRVREKSRECHNHKLQPFTDPKRKRKPTNPNKHKSNKRTKSTKIRSLFPKRGNRNTKRTEKHKNKMTHGKSYNNYIYLRV